MTLWLSLYCDQICNNGNQQSVESLKYAPINNWTQEIATRLFNKRADCFQYIPDHLITMEMCVKVVHARPSMLTKIPNRFKTRDLCMDVIRRGTGSIQWVPYEMITADFCRDVFSSFSSLGLGYLARYIPETVLNELLAFFMQRCDDVLPALRIQPKEVCLEYYQRSRTTYYQDIRSDENRRFVVRFAVSDIVVALRAAGLSTNLLVEIFESMGPALYPTLNRSGSPLSPLQLWSTVAAANHA